MTPSSPPRHPHSQNIGDYRQPKMPDVGRLTRQADTEILDMKLLANVLRTCKSRFGVSPRLYSYRTVEKKNTEAARTESPPEQCMHVEAPDATSQARSKHTFLSRFECALLGDAAAPLRGMWSSRIVGPVRRFRTGYSHQQDRRVPNSRGPPALALPLSRALSVCCCLLPPGCPWPVPLTGVGSAGDRLSSDCAFVGTVHVSRAMRPVPLRQDHL